MLIYIPSDGDHKVCRMLIAQVAYIVMFGNSSESAPLEPPDCFGSRDFLKEDQRALSGENGHMTWESSMWPQTVPLG